MSPTAFAVTAVVVLTVFIICFLVYQNRKITRYISQSYGKKRDDGGSIRSRMELIEQLYITESGDLPEEETIDDITWNDLSMDEIFACLDHTDSFAGEQYLYSRLRQPFVADSEAFEQKIALFDGDEQKRLKVRKKLFALGKNTIDYDIPLIAEGLSSLKIKETPFCVLLLCTLIGTGTAALVLRSSVAFTLFALIFFLNMMIYLVLKRKTDSKQKLLFGIGKMLGTAEAVCKAVPELSGGLMEKLKELRPAMRISSFIESKLINDSKDDFSALAAYLFGPFMTDILLYGRLLARLQKKHSECLAVYRFLGSIDAAISVGSFRRSLERYCEPTLTEEDSFAFEEVVHPLIKSPVPNDLTFERNIIITGSNASGKSTFVKAAAVNLLLGQTINTCTAKSAVIPRCGIITSMAVKDDVLSGDSYYIREIKYLRRMVELCEKGRLLFLAIDEILKGTNTRERIAASKAILDYLEDKRCMLVTATHDLELAETFNDRFDNIYFSECIKENDVGFDYKLHKGISRTSNAIKLLSVIGFPDMIIERAEEYKQ